MVRKAKQTFLERTFTRRGGGLAESLSAMQILCQSCQLVTVSSHSDIVINIEHHHKYQGKEWP